MTQSATVKRYVPSSGAWFFEVGCINRTEDFEVGDRNPAFVLATDYDALAAQLSACQARVEEAEKDARRYRCIRTELSGAQSFQHQIEISFVLPKQHGYKLLMSAVGLDEYVDAVIARDSALGADGWGTKP